MPADTEVDVAMANARPPDSPGAVLARARIEGALFGTPSSVARFHVLERLGKGGMGIVYAAYDPELDRGVALKMVNVPANARELALAEGKALARLSHPNVVPVFDVGIFEDQVYLVMELVRGTLLADWVAGQSPRAIVDAYRQAGAALAAAHEAGLVHRDFKPANAIVGTDGRLRVVDFGLACERATRAAAAGTPRYMAPELRDGEVTPAADQYSFCVALGDALGPQAPRWVADIVTRGRAPDPAARFPSMHELVRALGRDPARVWRWRIGGGAVVAALAIAFFVGHSRASDADLCTGGTAELATAWPAAERDAQLARIATLGPYGAELAGSVTRSLQAHRTSWAAGHRDACLAHRRGESSPALLDRRMVCLDRSRAALTAVADVMAHAEATTLSEVALAVSALPEPAVCAQLSLASELEPPPRAAAPRVAALRRDIDRARVLVAAGKTVAARDLAHHAATALAAIPYAPLLAEAQLVEGHAMLRTDKAGSLAAFDRALATAIAARRDAIAIEAWARRAWIIGTWRGEPDLAMGGYDVLDALAARTPDATFARALLYNNAGSLALARERRPEARRLFALALRQAEKVHGPGAVELAAVHRNLALVTDDELARDAGLARSGDTLARLLGPGHPDVLLVQYTRATTRLDLAAAGDLLAATCLPMVQHESLSHVAAECFVELADLRDLLGRPAEALAALEQAHARPHEDLLEVDGTLALWRGDVVGAIATLETALAKEPPAADAPLFERFDRAKLELAYGRALRRAPHRNRDAYAAFARAAAQLGAVDDHMYAVKRRVAAIAAERLAMLGSP